MALPPTIPTSFVPKQPVATHARHQRSGSNVFMLIGGSILIASIVIAGATFAFGWFLKSSLASKEAELAQAQQAVNIEVVEDFIRLRNRLSAVGELLDQHVELSAFFDVLEQRTLETVRFNGLSVSVEDDRSAEIETGGVARSFNALAAQSNEFAAEKRIKRAIFSDITVNPNGTVAFTLTAILDPRLITSAEILPGIQDTQAPAALPQAPVQAPAGTATTTRTATTSPTAL